jgi:hypothetical protein
MGVVGTVPHEFVLPTQGLPPQLTSSTNPTQGMWSPNPAVIIAWDGGNPGLGYYHVFDQYPTTRPTPNTGVFEPTNKNPPQLLMQNVGAGRRWFHMLALDSMGYSTRSAAHYEIDVGTPPDAGTVAGTVKDAADAGIVGATIVLQRGLYTTTSVAGGVYTFGNTIPAGQYEAVAKMPTAADAGFQAVATMLTVSPFQTSEFDFVLPHGSGCPTCTDLCAGVACVTQNCSGPPTAGTCSSGACVGLMNGDAPIPLQLNATYSGNTDGRLNHFYGSNSAYGYGAPDMLFSFTAPTSRSYTFRVVPAFNASAYVLTSQPNWCGPAGTPIAEVTYSSSSSTFAVIYSASAGQTVYVVLDGYYYSYDHGAFTLSVQ